LPLPEQANDNIAPSPAVLSEISNNEIACSDGAHVVAVPPAEDARTPASAAASSEPAAVAVEDARTPVERALAKAKADAKGNINDEIAPDIEPFCADDLPEIPWVIENFVARRMNVLLVGPGGVSKSTYDMQVMVGLVAGRSDLCGYEMQGRQRVWMLNQEDDFDQMKRRLAAIMEWFGVTWDDLRDENGKFMFRMRSGLNDRISVVEREGSGFKAGRDMESVVASIKKFRADIAVFDPLISLHPGNELDNSQMREVMDILNPIAFQCDCGMLTSHHTPKPDKASSRGFAGNVNAARGASAIVDAARGTVTLMGMSEDDLKKWKLPPGDLHSRYVRLDDARTYLAAGQE
jgi:RecA-family ATPase